MIKIGKNIKNGKKACISGFLDVINKKDEILTESINTLLIGKTGTRKTTLLKKIINKIKKDEDIIIIDFFKNYESIKGDHIKIIHSNILETVSEKDIEEKLNNILDNINQKAHSNRNKTIIIDESHHFLGKYKSVYNNFIKILKESRNNKIRYIIASQSMSDFDDNIKYYFHEDIQLFINKGNVEEKLNKELMKDIEKYNEDNKIFAIINNIEEKNIICKI